MGVRCCVMQAYFRPDTRANRAAWVIFAAAIVIGFIFTPLGASRLSACGRQYQKCLATHQLTPSTDYYDVCTQVLYQCNAYQWYQVFIWGIIFFIVAGSVLCYFWCCAVPPGYQPGARYTVTGTSIMVGAAHAPGHPLEAQPLFHQGLHYSSPVQHYGQMGPHGGGPFPPPPPYQFAQLYPTHTPGEYYVPQAPGGLALQTFGPPMYTVTLSPTDNDLSLSNGIAPGMAAMGMVLGHAVAPPVPAAPDAVAVATRPADGSPVPEQDGDCVVAAQAPAVPPRPFSFPTAEQSGTVAVTSASPGEASIPEAASSSGAAAGARGASSLI